MQIPGHAFVEVLSAPSFWLTVVVFGVVDTVVVTVVVVGSVVVVVITVVFVVVVMVTLSPVSSDNPVPFIGASIQQRILAVGHCTSSRTS